jgi:hypothetical protein
MTKSVAFSVDQSRAFIAKAADKGGLRWTVSI